MSEKTQNSKEPLGELEHIVKRRFIGMMLAMATVVPLLGMISYDWRDVSALRFPVLSPCANLLGEFGAWMVFYGYLILGFAIWLVPSLMVNSMGCPKWKVACMVIGIGFG